MHTEASASIKSHYGQTFFTAQRNSDKPEPTNRPMTSSFCSVTAIILTYNEERHIARCIESLSGAVARVVVIDSGSTDHTEEIARSFGADFLSNPWKNHATQFQWGLDNAGINTEWTMRIDADEYLEPELRDNIRRFCQMPGDANAAYFRRKMVFLGRPITHGLIYPAMILRLWRTGLGRMEQRWMDEHVIVEAPVTARLDGDLVDENLNDLGWWTAKHVGYATREVYEIVANHERECRTSTARALAGEARRKRFLKDNVYVRLPSALRSTLYFFYRYFLGLGFLDGKAGFYFHFLQAYWYRTLVDAKLYELERRAAELGLRPYELLVREGVFGGTPRG
jgi:glycosyltransferase involved in cell wall biosynthesis